MKVTYQEIDKNFKALSDIFFLKNQNLWFLYSPNKKSRYFGGFLLFENQALRFLDDINFYDEILEGYILSTQEIIFFFKNNQAYLKLNPDSLEITFSSWQNINLTFDFKKIFKNEPEKRKIEIKKISSCCLTVEEFLENNGFVKILVEADSPLEVRQTWILKKMTYDEKRNSPPSSWWVLDGIFGKVRELKIKIVQPQILQKKSEIIFKSQNLFCDFLLFRINALVLDNYLAAGFPWFYENWLRDELLSLYLLKDTLREEFLEKRLKFYINNLENIWLLNKQIINEGQQGLAADTFLLLVLNLNKVFFHSHFTLLEKYFQFWKEKFIKNNELDLPAYSTWMDTLERKTALEIESLYLRVLRKFAKENKFYVEEAGYREERLIAQIKNNHSDINLIFAFLFLEDIFSLKEWERYFDKLIKTNFLNWGGFSTLPQNDINFKDEDDGELSKAYHQGNSWYFLNNLIAYALTKINPQKYKDIIEKIIKASLNDLFVDGALGYSSEISSAKERRSEGSLIQLWSIASLIYFFLKSGYQFQTFEQ